MDTLARMIAERECEAASIRFFHHLDRRDYDSVTSLMAEGGVWVRQGTELAGAHAIAAALHGRPSNVATRHLINNLVVNVLDDRSAKVAYELSVYAKDGDAPAVHLAVMTGEDRLEHDGVSWLIRLKRAEKVFGFDR